jgi:NAD+ synthetase
MAADSGVHIDQLPISDALSAVEEALDQVSAERPGIVQENLQARIRGLLLMAESNRDGSLVLATSNKSESAVGYATLYGDMCGAIAPIADLYKTDVWALAQWRNSQTSPPVIPPTIISRPPSAELRPDQLDTDSLPDYETLDQILFRMIEGDQDVAQISAAGFDETVVRHIATLLVRSQYKRAQAAPVIRVSARAFGKDWRRPIVCARTSWS